MSVNVLKFVNLYNDDYLTVCILMIIEHSLYICIMYSGIENESCFEKLKLLYYWILVRCSLMVV